MNRYIPYEKLSKRKKRELDQARRGSWGEINPVTRKSKEEKRYDRNRRRYVPEEGRVDAFSLPA